MKVETRTFFTPFWRRVYGRKQLERRTKEVQFFKLHRDKRVSNAHSLNRNGWGSFTTDIEQLYTQQQKKRENLLLLNWLKVKYVEFKKYILHVKLTVFHVEFKKYILHVKLTVFHTVSFTCNIYFLNSTYFIFNQLKSNKLSFAVQYIIKQSIYPYEVWQVFWDFSSSKSEAVLIPLLNQGHYQNCRKMMDSCINMIVTEEDECSKR